MRSGKMFNATHIQPALKREACTHYFVQNSSIKNQLYRRARLFHMYNRRWDFDTNLPVKMPKMRLASSDPLGCAYQEVYSQLGTDPRARHLESISSNNSRVRIDDEFTRVVTDMHYLFRY